MHRSQQLRLCLVHQAGVCRAGASSPVSQSLRCQGHATYRQPK